MLLVGGPPGPLGLWLILLILLLHQRDWGEVEKSKRGRGWKPSGQALGLRPLPVKEEQCIPPNPHHLPTLHPRQGTWVLETACSVLGKVPWGPNGTPPLSSLHADTSGDLGSRKWGPEALWPNPTLPGTSHPSWGWQLSSGVPKAPPRPATPHLGRVLIALSFWLHQGLY